MHANARWRMRVRPSGPARTESSERVLAELRRIGVGVRSRASMRMCAHDRLTREPISASERSNAVVNRALLILLFAGCVTQMPDLSVRRGPRGQWQNAVSDPFASRRDVSSTPSQEFRSGDCSGELFSGPRGCFVGLVHEQPCRPVTDAGCFELIGMPLQSDWAHVEYWLNCGESASPCGAAVRCDCGPVID